MYPQVSYNYTNIPASKGNIQQDVKDNSGKVAAGGAVGTATFATLKKSAQVGKGLAKTVNNSKALTYANKQKILKIFSRYKFFRNPIIQKTAGPLAAFSALAATVGSVAKVADTCTYLTNQKK